MDFIADISKHQKSSLINWGEFSKHISMLIIRVQYGSTAPDIEYKNHVLNAKKYKIPFYSYAFPEFISVADARVEAKDAANRQDKDSLGMVLDVETEYDSKTKKPLGITKLSQSVRIEGIKAFVDELRKQGVKCIGGYIGSNIYESWEINKIINIFDFIWIPDYDNNDGKPHTKPKYQCDLWQYTSVGRVPGYNGNLDLSILNGNKDLNWFLRITPKKEEIKIDNSIPKWAEDDYELAIKLGITDGSKPYENITRLQAAVMMARLYKLIEDLSKGGNK